MKLQSLFAVILFLLTPIFSGFAGQPFQGEEQFLAKYLELVSRKDQPSLNSLIYTQNDTVEALAMARNAHFSLVQGDIKSMTIGTPTPEEKKEYSRPIKMGGRWFAYGEIQRHLIIHKKSSKARAETRPWTIPLIYKEGQIWVAVRSLTVADEPKSVSDSREESRK